jgi:hypothetical protein
MFIKSHILLLLLLLDPIVQLPIRKNWFFRWSQRFRYVRVLIFPYVGFRLLILQRFPPTLLITIHQYLIGNGVTLSLAYHIFLPVTNWFVLFYFLTLIKIDVIGLITGMSNEREYVRDGKVTNMVVLELTDTRWF